MKQEFAGNKNTYYDNSGKISDNLYSFDVENHKINDEAIYDFLLYGTILPPNSPFHDIHAMFPGEKIEYNKVSQKYNKSNDEYQELAHTKINYLWSVDKFASKLDNIFENYFQEEIINNKLISIMLSGGVDSSIISSYLPKNTVTATWAGWGTSTTDLTYSRIIAKHFNLAEPLISKANFLSDLELYKECIQKLKHPIPFGYIAFAQMAKNVQKKFNNEHGAIFMGQNADTIAGSFKSIAYTHYLSKLNHLWPFLTPYFKKKALKARKYYLLSTTNPIEIKSFFHSNGINPGTWINVPNNYFDKKYNQIKNQLKLNPWWYKHYILIDELMTGARRDQYAQNQLPALYNIQTLVPFYNKEVVRLFLSVPQRIRRRSKFGKVILKELARKRNVPEEIIIKKKKGLAYGFKDLIAKEEHLPIWCEMEKNDILNKYIDIKKIRAKSENNFATFEILISLHYFFKLVLNKS